MTEPAVPCPGVPYWEFAALIIAVIALVISFLSWRSAKQALKAAMFDRRYEVYSAAEAFIRSWMRDGRPSVDELPTLVRAWRKSELLCKKEAQQYLEKLRRDATVAFDAHNIESGDAEGDPTEARERRKALLAEHEDFKLLIPAFKRDLRVD